MRKNQFPLAGVFFADDHVIVSAADFDSDKSYPAVTLLDGRGALDLASNPPIRFASQPNDPEADVRNAVEALASFTDLGKLRSLAAAAPGPFFNSHVDPVSSGPDRLISEGYGALSDAARRPAWRSFHLYEALHRHLNAFGANNTVIQCMVDVESFVFAEHYLYRKVFDFSGPGQDTVVYLLLDEGVGATAFKRNAVIKGDHHAELGHIPVAPHTDDDGKPPVCVAHEYSCLESLISIPAMKWRWGLEKEAFAQLPGDALPVQLTAYYIAEALAFLTLAFTPTVVLIGGRLMENGALLQQIRLAYLMRMRTADGASLYPNYPAQYAEEFIKRWSYPDTGVLGCLCHAERMRPDRTIAQIGAR